MNLAAGIVVYLVVWWLVLFMVLPWGVRSQFDAAEVSPGTEPGAPAEPKLWRKAIVTTIIATAVWLVIYYVLGSGILNLGAPIAP